MTSTENCCLCWTYVDGSIVAQSALTGEVTVTKSGTVYQLEGTFTGVSNLTGSYGIKRGLSSTISAQSTVSGSSGINRGLSGSFGGLSDLTGEAKIAKIIQAIGNIDGISRLTCIPNMSYGLTGTFSGNSRFRGERNMTHGLSGTLGGQSSLSATKTRIRYNTGSISAGSSLTLSIGVNRGLSGSIISQSYLEGHLLHLLEGNISAHSKLYIYISDATINLQMKKMGTGISFSKMQTGINLSKMNVSVAMTLLDVITDSKKLRTEVRRTK